MEYYIVAIIIVVILIVIGIAYYLMTRTKASKWRCVGDIYTPLIIDKDGNVACKEDDDKFHCALANDKAGCEALLPPEGAIDVRALACGEQHKSRFGSTGYDDPNHWCSKGKVLLS